MTATPGTLSATVQWTPNGSAADTYTVTSNPGGITTTVDGAATSATVTGLGYLLRYTFTVSGTNSLGTGPASAPSEAIIPGAPGGPYHQGDGRVLANDDVTAGQPLRFNTGEDRVHAPGLSAVVLNVTASQASTATGVQVVEMGEVAETVSVVPGQVQSSLVVLTAPAELTQAAVQVTTGTVHVQIDFVGDFTDPRTLRDHAGILTMVAPATLLDASLASGSSTDVAVLGQGGVPSAHVGEVLLNVTATGAAGSGALALVPTGSTATGITTLGFAAGETTANRAIVAVSSSGSVSIIDSYAAATVHVDVLGWFSDGTDTAAIGGLYNPLPSARLVDTTAAGGPVAAGTTLNFPVYGQGGAPPVTATAPPTSVIVDITAVAPAGAGSISVAGATVLDFAAGDTVSRTAVIHLASDGSATLAVNGSASNITVDLTAFFAGDLIVPGSTKVLPQALLATITGIGNADDFVTFSPGTQISPTIQLNDVIVAGPSAMTPQGFLLRVRSITTQLDGTIVVGTRDASLSEALTAYTLDGVIVPSFGPFSFRSNRAPALTSQNPGITLNSCPGPPMGTSIDSNCPSLRLGTIVAIANALQTDTLPDLSADGSLHLFPVPWADLALTELQIQVLPHFHIEYNFSNNTAKAFFAWTVGLKYGVELTVTKDLVSAGAVKSFVIGLGRTIWFDIGPVPVSITPTLTIAVTLDASISAGLRFAYHYDKWSQVAESYDGSAFHTSASDLTYVNGFDPPAFEADAEAKLALHAGPGLTFYRFCVVLPIINLRKCVNPFTVGVDFSRYVKGTATVTCTPQPSCFPNPWWTLASGTCIGVFMRIDLFFSSKYFQRDLACEELVLLHAPGPHLNVIITPSSVTVPRFHVQHFHAVVSNSPSGVTFSVLGGDANGTLSNRLFTTDIDYTAPGTPGDYKLEAAAIDDTSSVTAALIHVPADPPSLPRNVAAALTGLTSVTVTWSAPSDNGGAPITDYKVVSSDGTTIDAGTSTSAIFTGLIPGNTYTFTVFATNSANLTSAAAVSSPVTVPATQAVVTITPASIDFGADAIGNPTQPQTVTVSVGGGSLAVSGVALGGARPQDYAIQNDLCSGKTITAPGSCSFQVVFTAAIVGTSNATALITDDAIGSPQSVALQGEGPVASRFGPVQATQFVDAQHGWVSWVGGTWATTDGGKTWKPETFPSGNPNGGQFRFIDAMHGWLVGRLVATTPGCFGSSNCNAVMGTSDGGQTWTRLALIPLTYPTDIWFSDASHGWISAYTFTACDQTGIGCARTQLYATNDGGHTWALQSLPDPQFGSCTLAVDERVLAVSFVDATNGWALGMSGCLNHTTQTVTNPLTLAWSTTDGGAHWTAHNTGLNEYYFGPLSRLHVLSAAQVGFATGDLNQTPIFVTSTDGGVTWSKSAIPDVSVSDFHYLDASHIVLIGGRNGAQSIYTSSDGGNTWTKGAPLPAQVNVANSNTTALQFIEIVDASHWWVAGVLFYTNTEAGVVYMSSDGGATWTLQVAGNGTI